MADPMKIRANAVGDSTEVKVLMSHEMETGQRKDAQGKTIPAWHIQTVAATWNGKTILSALGGNVSGKTGAGRGGAEALSMDDLARATGLTPGEVRAEVTVLELQRRVVRQGSRIGRA